MGWRRDALHMGPSSLEPFNVVNQSRLWQPVTVTTMNSNNGNSKRSTFSIVHGLLYTTGFMLLLYCLPMGLFMYFSQDKDIAPSVSLFMMLAMATIGTISLCSGILITKVQRRKIDRIDKSADSDKSNHPIN